jgi:hypothetical protein
MSKFTFCCGLMGIILSCVPSLVSPNNYFLVDFRINLQRRESNIILMSILSILYRRDNVVYPFTGTIGGPTDKTLATENN